ncbi:response regulator [Leptolyngbya sp. FACHB-321]|uniref:response regulator n=1 Tax=Leptolyngbya sp. FACHB-321 TaxID=2692807 RepID=UPI001683E5EF|nr:response regulator [Leptolyngbya sp. FACHB-321]MBD2036395.1 response regulator [Leptolyngbya sp. FACHB-321]
MTQIREGISQIEPTRILLVEDDPNDVELIRLAFRNYNLVNQLDVVADGEQALHYLLGQEGIPLRPLPRFVLLDLKLPKISGIRVLQTLRSHPRTQQLIIVVMTSSQEDSDLNTCYDLGVNSYIVKPLDFQQFLTVTRDVGLYWMLLNKSPLFPF